MLGVLRAMNMFRDGSSEEFLGGLRGPAGQNFGAAACHHNFCKWISCKTGLKLGLKLLNWAKTAQNWAKTAQEARRRRFFLENNLFSSNFWCLLGGL